jgi:hypothetical protein
MAQRAKVSVLLVTSPRLAPLNTRRSTRNLPGGKGRPARKADNLIVIWEPTV